MLSMTISGGLAIAWTGSKCDVAMACEMLAFLRHGAGDSVRHWRRATGDVCRLPWPGSECVSSSFLCVSGFEFSKAPNSLLSLAIDGDLSAALSRASSRDRNEELAERLRALRI